MVNRVDCWLKLAEAELLVATTGHKGLRDVTCARSFWRTVSSCRDCSGSCFKRGMTTVLPSTPAVAAEAAAPIIKRGMAGFKKPAWPVLSGHTFQQSEVLEAQEDALWYKSYSTPWIQERWLSLVMSMSACHVWKAPVSMPGKAVR